MDWCPCDAARDAVFRRVGDLTTMAPSPDRCGARDLGAWRKRGSHVGLQLKRRRSDAFPIESPGGGNDSDPTVRISGTGLVPRPRACRPGALGVPGASTVPYGQPAAGAGAWTISTWPVPASSAALAGPPHSVAMMNNVRSSGPPRVQAKPP